MDRSPPQALNPPSELIEAFETLATRNVVLFGGKGGVGKTTISAVFALYRSRSSNVVLLATDPASNLADLAPSSAPFPFRTESIDADALYQDFLTSNLPSFLELGDRGTLLDREELRRLFQLALPGVDELMSWIRIGELATENAVLVVDTAPTGHALRMLESGRYFERFTDALEAMQAKHRDLVEQLTRRPLRDALDGFIENFRNRARRAGEVLLDRTGTAFIPVTLSEPWIVSQTLRIAEAVEKEGLVVPFVIHNRWHADDSPGCTDPAVDIARPLVRAPLSCRPLSDTSSLHEYLDGVSRTASPAGAPLDRAVALELPGDVRLIFVAGKGGTGKTSTSCSLALQLAATGAHVTLLSIDPAHGLRDAMSASTPPATLEVEYIDTASDWQSLRESLGAEIDRAVDALTPRGLTIAHEGEVMHQLLDIGPPGADEIFALVRLHDLLKIEDQVIVVDTAPTGHFLRFLDLPRTAGEWVRELIRVLLAYRDVIAPGALGSELVNASRALTSFEKILISRETAVVVVSRPEPLVVQETARLEEELRTRGILRAATVVNYVEPQTDCPCSASIREWQLSEIAALSQPALVVERRQRPPSTTEDLQKLIPLVQTPAR